MCSFCDSTKRGKLTHTIDARSSGRLELRPVSSASGWRRLVSQKWKIRASKLAYARPMVTVCDISALARWGEAGLADRLGQPCDLPAGEAWSLASAAELSKLDLRAARLEATPDRPLHVLVSSEEHRIRTPSVRSHIWSTPLPDNALWRLTDEVLLASPRFCLQQMAPRSSDSRIAKIATEICGAYARSPRASHGFYGRPPLDTPELLRDHFCKNHGYGAKRARRALCWVVAGSRSPMETVVVLLFTLPVEMGGCGMPAPRLNFRLEIPRSLQIAIGRPYVVVDLCWEQWGIILEYDSYKFHSDPASVDSDSARNEGLRDLGWMVRSVTAGMLTNDFMLDELVRKVTARAGVSVPDDEAYLRKRHALVRELMGE